MPKFREMNCTSAYEVVIDEHRCFFYFCLFILKYLEKRFDRSVRMCASFAFSFFMVIDDRLISSESSLNCSS